MPIPTQLTPLTSPTHPTFLMELKRKAIHVLALIIPAGLCNFPEKPALILLFVVTGASLVVELLRFCFPPVQRLFMSLFSPLLREHETKLLTGSTALCLSASVCTAIFLFYSKAWFLEDTARLSLFYAFTFIILGDAAAALFGKLYGKKKILQNKTWAGAWACFITCILVYFITKGFIIWNFPWEIAFIGAFLTTFLEILPFKLDDNLRVAPVTCFTMYAFLKSGIFL